MATDPDPRTDITKGAGEDASAPLGKEHPAETGISPAKLAWLVVGLAALFYTYEFALRILPSVMEEQLLAHFHLMAGGFGVLSACYYFVYTPMQLPVGLLMDRFGPRVLLTVATMVCAGAVFLFAATSLLPLAYFARGLMGFGSAFAFIGAMKLAAIWFPPHRFALFSGLISSLGMVGAMAGDDIMAEMVTGLGWQTTCFVMGAIGVGLGVAIWFVVRDTPPRGYQVAPHHSMDASVRKLWISFWKVATRAQTWKAGFAGAIMFLPVSVIGSLWGPSDILSGHPSLNLAEATSVVTMVFLGYAIGSPVIGHLSDHYRNRKLPMVIGAVGLAVTFGLFVMIPGLPVWALYVLTFLIGVFSSAEALVFVVGREANRADAAGTAIAMINMLVTLGGALFQPIVGYILQYEQMTYGGARKTSTGEIYYTAEQFHWAFLPMLVLMVLNIGLVLWIKETHAHQHHAHAPDSEGKFDEQEV